ncbi:MAG: molybdopterin molybdotransferase MoeA [Deltaproteobacteria bacterium]|nr:molybdopterin molybdotransferase MoeA [Deltaproteobacteria bacterium]
MISLAEARKRVLEGLSPLPGEQAGPEAALGRILSEPVVARRTLPPFDNSAMDGYALRAADTAGASEAAPVLLPLAREIAAGAPAGEALEALPPGHAARIFTGAPLPPGADAVVMQERCEAAPQGVRVGQAASVGQNIRPRGDEIEAGEVLLPAGSHLGPLELSAALSQGRSLFFVHRRPRVAIFTSGDELVEADREPGPGQIVSSNSLALAAACRQAGAEASVLGVARDTPEAIAGLVERARGHDLILSSGGVSVGDHDHVRGVLLEAGFEEDFWKVATKPGKPILFGRLDGRPVFGLPGNPVSALVGFYLLVRPLLRRLRGLESLRETTPALLTAEAPCARGRAQVSFVRCRGRSAEGLLQVEPLSGQASHRTARAAGGEGFVIAPPDRALPAGTPVEVEWIVDEPRVGA